MGKYWKGKGQEKRKEESNFGGEIQKGKEKGMKMGKKERAQQQNK